MVKGSTDNLQLTENTKEIPLGSPEEKRKSNQKSQRTDSSSKKQLKVQKLLEKKNKKDKGPKFPLYLMLILGLNCLNAFGQDYVFDFPQALEGPLIRWLGANTFKISFFYSIYALPNLIMSPISGYVMERIGNHHSSLLFPNLVFLGQIIISIGIYMQEYYIVLLGRGIFGIGAEGITVLQLVVNEYWFSGRFLSIAIAWSDMWAAIGLLAGNFFTPYIFFATRNIQWCFFVCGITCFLTSLNGVVYYFMHIKYCHTVNLHNKAEKSELKSAKSKDEPAIANFAIAESKISEDKVDKPKPAESDRLTEGERTLQFGFKSIKYFNVHFWILCFLMLFMANCYHQFMNLCTEIMVHRFNIQYDSAFHLVVIPETSFILFSPPLAIIIEKGGRKGQWLIFGCLTFLSVYVYMYFMPVEESFYLYICLVAIGFAYCVLSCCLFTSVALVIPKCGTSMGYSMVTVVNNIGLASLPLIFGKIAHERTVAAYSECLLLLCGVAACATLMATALYIYDTATLGILSPPENENKVKRMRLKIDNDFLQKSGQAKAGTFRGSAKKSRIV